MRTIAGGTRQARSTFHFDEVMSSFSTQADVFNASLEPLVSQVLHGYEATAFAYGQTGTGKTHTMEGDLDSEEGRGLVPRAAAAIIDELSSGKYTDHSVTVSYLEIYNEELSDMLTMSTTQQKLDLKDVGNGKGVVCIGLSEVSVTTLGEILELVRHAQERRRVAETRVNARSSRSHSIFTMKVRCRKRVSMGELESIGKLHLVDLAGSECAKKATIGFDEVPSIQHLPQAGGHEEERERRSINQSLLTLGRVIQALRSDTAGRVPYRDSKLTRLLQNALGGHCKTVIIATISPALNAVEETISTLTYAEQAAGIRNRPVAQSLLRTTRPAPAMGQPSVTNTSDWNELEMKLTYLTHEVEEAQTALARKYKETQELVERTEVAEEQLSCVSAELTDTQLALEESRFVADHYVAVADRQIATAKSMSSTLESMNALGKGFAAQLSARCGTIDSMRAQGRSLCAAAEADVERCRGQVKTEIESVIPLVGGIFGAHCDTASTAEETAKAHESLIGNLSVEAQRESEKICECLQTSKTQAAQKLSAEHATVVQMLDAVAIAGNCAKATAQNTKSFISVATTESKASFGQRADKLDEHVKSGGQTVQTTRRRGVEDVAAARVSFEKGHCAAKSRLQNVRDPFVSLQNVLQRAMGDAAMHASATSALKEREAERVEAAGDRRERLFSALRDVVTGNDETLSSRRPPLDATLERLGSLLDGQSRQAATVTSSIGDRLAGATAELGRSMRQGEEGLSTVMTEATFHLTNAWDSGRAVLDGFRSTLKGAIAEQNAGNASADVCAKSAAGARDLEAATTFAVTNMADVRDAIVTQVTALREQRSSEQAIVNMLGKQRETLEADIERMRGVLQSTKEELESTRSALASVGVEQTQGRERAMNAIMSTVRAELENLGRDFSSGSSCVNACLDKVTALTTETQDQLQPTSDRNCEVGRGIAGTAEAWSQGVDASCTSIDAAQEHSDKTIAGMSHANSVAQSLFHELDHASQDWGKACCSVADSMSSAVDSAVRLQASEDELRPWWVTVREQVGASLAGWVDGDGAVISTLSTAETENVSLRVAIEELQTSVSEQHATCVGQVEAWFLDAEQDTTSLVQALELGESLAEEDTEAEESRSLSILAMSEEASDLSAQCSGAQANATNILVDLDGHIALLPADAKATDNAMGTAAETMEKLCSQATACLEEVSDAAVCLRQTQSDASDKICTSVCEYAQTVSSAAEASLSSVSAQQTAATDALQGSLALWEKVIADALSGLRVTTSFISTTNARSVELVKAGNQRVANDLCRSESMKQEMLTALDKLTSNTSSSLQKNFALWRQGLSADPMAAFSERKENAEAWPEYQHHVFEVPTSVEVLANEFRQTKENIRTEIPKDCVEVQVPRGVLVEVNSPL